MLRYPSITRRRVFENPVGIGYSLNSIAQQGVRISNTTRKAKLDVLLPTDVRPPAEDCRSNSRVAFRCSRGASTKPNEFWTGWDFGEEQPLIYIWRRVAMLRLARQPYQIGALWLEVVLC